MVYVFVLAGVNQLQEAEELQEGEELQEVEELLEAEELQEVEEDIHHEVVETSEAEEEDRFFFSYYSICAYSTLYPLCFVSDNRFPRF